MTEEGVRGSSLHLGLKWLMLLILGLGFPEHFCTHLVNSVLH